MARRTFRYDPTIGKMVEIERAADVALSPMVIGDCAAFVSPLDGTIVEGRRQYYEHMKRHNVVPFEQGSEKQFTRKHPDPAPRREAIWEAVDRSIQRSKRR